MAGLQAIGLDLLFKHDAPRRLIFTLTKDDSGADNVIAGADAAAIANWQTQFDKWSHLSDSSDRFVVTPLIREFTIDDIEAENWEVEDYKRKMRDGYVDISVSFLDPAPAVFKNMKYWEDYTVSVWIVSEDAKALGILSSTNLKPYPIKANSLTVPNWRPGAYDEGSRNVMTFRLNAATDLNNSVGVPIADADATSDSDFYSLRPSSMTTANPAVTGCDFIPTVDDTDPDAAYTAIPITGITYDEVVFKLTTSPYTEVSLAAAGSISHSSGTYTVNEAALLTSALSYDIIISHSQFDIIKQTITIP